MLIRNVPPEVKREIEVRAARHGHSTQKEALDILVAGTLRGAGKRGLGTRLQERFADIGFPDLELPVRSGEPRAAELDS